MPPAGAGERVRAAERILCAGTTGRAPGGGVAAGGPCSCSETKPGPPAPLAPRGTPGGGELGERKGGSARSSASDSDVRSGFHGVSSASPAPPPLAGVAGAAAAEFPRGGELLGDPLGDRPRMPMRESAGRADRPRGDGMLALPPARSLAGNGRPPCDEAAAGGSSAEA